MSTYANLLITLELVASDLPSELLSIVYSEV